MAITIYNLFEAVLLCINAMAVLHEKRFLDKINWGKAQVHPGYEAGPKAKLVNLIHSVRTVMRSKYRSHMVYVIVTACDVAHVESVKIAVICVRHHTQYVRQYT
uniref:Immediate early response 3-interacting protein 1 n=1 Tax=Ornithodoros turicata TaxID=34597 RepID=A0A2R5LDY8_9ACAR